MWKSERGKVGVWWIVLGVIVALVAGTVITILGRIGSLGSQVQAEIARIKAAGEPVTIADIVGAPVPDSQNAALVYQKAFKFMSGPTWEKDEALIERIIYPGNPLQTKQEWRDTSRAIARYRSVVPLVEQAQRLPKCKFPVDLSKGPLEATLPQYSKTRSLSRLLGADAVILARQGKVDNALHLLDLSFRMASEVTRFPTEQTSLMAHISMIKIAANALREVLKTRGAAEMAFRQPYGTLGAVDLSSDLVTALQGERVQGIWLLEMTRGHPKSLAELYGITTRIGRGWTSRCNADELYYLRKMRSLIDAARLPPMEASKRFAVIQAAKLPKYALFSGILMPMANTLSCVRDESQAEIALARTALALAAYRTRFGSYPATLAELRSKLGWKIEEDPFSGRDLIYNGSANSFVLYSIGPNLKDDGGREADSKRREPYASRDIAWRGGG